jgi:hypothetical protein
MLPILTWLYERAQDKWDTIRYVVDDNGRTARFCAIVLVMGLASSATLSLLLIALIHGLGI